MNKIRKAFLIDIKNFIYLEDPIYITWIHCNCRIDFGWKYQAVRNDSTRIEHWQVQ